MKKRLLSILGTIALLLSTNVLVSCSDNEPNDKPAVTEIIDASVMAYADTELISVPVKTTGNWTATLPDDCEWAMIISQSGKGDGTIRIGLDTNFGGAQRNTTLTLSAGNETYDVILTQSGELQGMVGENATDTQTLITRQLGYGYNALEQENNPKTSPKYGVNCVFNTGVLEKLMDSNPSLYRSLIMNTPRTNIDYQAAQMDTLLNKTDELSVKLSINVSYGMFSFGLSGAYSGKEDFNSNKLIMGYAAEYPVMDASIAYSDAMALYEDYSDEDDRDPQDLRAGIYAPGFLSKTRKLKKAIESKKQAQINNAVASIIQGYGTGVVVNSTLGGSVVMEMALDTIWMKEHLSVDSAKVTTKISIGLFKLDANISVDYVNEAITILKNTRYRVDIKGGSLEKSAALSTAFTTAQDGPALRNSLQTWINTLKDDSSGIIGKNCDLIGIEVTPIWMLFDDYDCQKAIYDYCAKLYPKSAFVREFKIE